MSMDNSDAPNDSNIAGLGGEQDLQYVFQTRVLALQR